MKRFVHGYIYSKNFSLVWEKTCTCLLSQTYDYNRDKKYRKKINVGSWGSLEKLQLVQYVHKQAFRTSRQWFILLDKNTVLPCTWMPMLLRNKKLSVLKRWCQPKRPKCYSLNM